MQAEGFRLEGPGGPEVLRYGRIEVGAPGPGELLIRHSAIGLNFIDTYHRSGLYPLPLPGGIGLEAAGVVEEVGPGVEGFAAGERIGYCWGPAGAYQTHRTIAADMVVKLPQGMSDETAAAALLKGCTAEFLIERCARIRAGDWVLLHAAAGGVGLIAAQWLKAIGARAIGTAGSAAKAALALANGCEAVIRYDEAPIAREVKALTGGAGVDVVLDGVGEAVWDASLESLKSRGMMVTFGNASGPIRPFEPLRLMQAGSLFLTRPSLFHYYPDQATKQAGTARLFEMIESGAVRIAIDQRWPLAEAADAHRALEARATTGSSVLLP